LPFDFFLSVSYAFYRCCPDVVIIAESDLWYRFLKQAKKKGAVCVVINGKLSAKSQKWYERFAFFSKRLFSLVDCFCMQDETYKKRLLSVGVAASKIEVTGNLKCDTETIPLTGQALQQLRERFSLQPQDLVVVIGSSHAPEEELLLKEIVPLMQRFCQLKVLIAPRHPERFEAVRSMLARFDVPYATWTKGVDSSDVKIVLIDTIGILKQCYQLADVAIVAGSFTDKVGGHNILEAQSFGIPVLTGPYMYTQESLLECSLAYDALEQVPIERVQSCLDDLLSHPAKRKELGSRALALAASINGATESTLKTFRQLIPQFFA
jgi:3-deoxy-D-manno-octulosonic-acid transferase